MSGAIDNRIKRKQNKKTKKSGEAAKHRESRGNIFPLAEGERGGRSSPNKAVRRAKPRLTDVKMQLTVKPMRAEVTNPKVKNCFM